jgi:hypothetical protein
VVERDLPARVGEAEVAAVEEVEIRDSDHDVDAEARVEHEVQVRAVIGVLAAIAVRRRVGRRSAALHHDLARRLHHDRGAATVRVLATGQRERRREREGGEERESVERCHAPLRVEVRSDGSAGRRISLRSCL